MKKTETTSRKTLRRIHTTPRFISDDYVVIRYVLTSHYDFSTANDVIVGIDRNLRLLISIEHTDYDNPRFNCSTWAELSTDETFRLARRLKVRALKLPLFIANCMDEWDDIPLPTLSDARACFKEITECLLDEGCHFRIKRTSGYAGFVCY